MSPFQIISFISKPSASLASSFEEIEALGVGGLRRAFEEGDTQTGSLMAGQSAAMVHEIQPCADIIKSYFDGTEAVIETITSKLK